MPGDRDWSRQNNAPGAKPFGKWNPGPGPPGTAAPDPPAAEPTCGHAVDVDLEPAEQPHPHVHVHVQRVAPAAVRGVAVAG